jgi:uncharacterized membrane protein
MNVKKRHFLTELFVLVCGSSIVEGHSVYAHHNNWKLYRSNWLLAKCKNALSTYLPISILNVCCLSLSAIVSGHCYTVFVLEISAICNFMGSTETAAVIPFSLKNMLECFYDIKL